MKEAFNDDVFDCHHIVDPLNHILDSDHRFTGK